MNDYKDEFDEEINAIRFIEWLQTNVKSFILNISRNGYPKKRTLREWLSWFLDWVEYGENK